MQFCPSSQAQVSSPVLPYCAPSAQGRNIIRKIEIIICVLHLLLLFRQLRLGGWNSSISSFSEKEIYMDSFFRKCINDNSLGETRRKSQNNIKISLTQLISVMRTGNIQQRITKMAEFIVILNYFNFWPYVVYSFFPLDLSPKILYPSFRYDNLRLHGLIKRSAIKKRKM